MTANVINHIVLVLDASGSMNSNSRNLIQVADNQIVYLAQRSKELDQETRITIYSFDDTAKCLIYDMDVLRVPSIKQLYRIGGMTAMIDATMLALNDLAMTPEKYGEHSFLVYVLTDGLENRSRKFTAPQLSAKIQGLPDHWTVATFVPNQVAVHEAKRFGFPAANISLWDTTAVGIAEVGTKIRETTENFMQGRKVGVRGSRNLFALETPSVGQISQNLTALPSDTYSLFPVFNAVRIDDFVRGTTGRPYKIGEAYYQLTKREEIQPQKQIAIVGKGGVFVGPAARQLLGLPSEHVNVSPAQNPDYEIFVQSTSVNRKLMPGTRLLVLK